VSDSQQPTSPAENTQRDRAINDLDRHERAIWRNVLLAAVVVGVVLMGLGWRLVAPRLASAQQLDRAQTLLVQTDPIFSGLDTAISLVASQPSTQTATVLASTAESVPATRARVTEALGLIKSAIPRLNDDEQRQALIIQSGAQGRLDALDAVPTILSAATKAASAPSDVMAGVLKALATGDTSAYQAGRKKTADAMAALKAL
jgi:hypothetical protein